MKVQIYKSEPIYVEDDRVIVSNGKTNPKIYHTCVIVRVDGAVRDVVYDDGQFGIIPIEHIVSYANKRLRKTSFGNDELPKYKLPQRKQDKNYIEQQEKQ